MKLKAVLQKDGSEELRREIESRAFRQRVLDEVLKRHLRAPDFGPAEFYIQECDLAESDPMCNVRLTGLSVNRRRSTDDFHQATEALETMYADAIRRHLPFGQRCQLYVELHLDRPPLDEHSSIIERPPIYIVGARVE